VHTFVYLCGYTSVCMSLALKLRLSFSRPLFFMGVAYHGTHLYPTVTVTPPPPIAVSQTDRSASGWWRHL
jgi:hypothetical protein